MAERQSEFEGLTIVILGSFNPAIFHPLWFARSNLIRPEEAEGVKPVIFEGQVAQFSADWLSVQVTQDRFMLETKDPTKSQPLRDIAIGTFKILEHTPLTAFGLNRERHFHMLSEEDWHSFGHFYAPKDPWAAILQNPGLVTMTMEGKRATSESNKVRVRIETSSKIAHGVRIHVHEHFDLGNQGPGQQGSTAVFLRELQASWVGFISYTEDVAKQLFARFDQRNGETP